jgi:hypothetical protein
MYRYGNALLTKTAQQVFDETYTMLKERGFQRALGRHSGDAEKTCFYRGAVGPCAAGRHVTDEEYGVGYNAEIEGKAWQDLRDNGLVPEQHASLLGELQRTHDHYSPNEMPEQFAYIAERFGLWMPEELRDAAHA